MSPIDYNVSAPADSDSRGNGAFFWPILILILGAVLSTGYQIGMMQEQLYSLKQANQQIDPKVRQAQYEKSKLYKLAADVLQLSTTDPKAKQIVDENKIQQTPPPATK